MNCKNQKGILYHVCKISDTDKKRDGSINNILHCLHKSILNDEDISLKVNEIIDDTGHCHCDKETCPHLK